MSEGQKEQVDDGVLKAALAKLTSDELAILLFFLRKGAASKKPDGMMRALRECLAWILKGRGLPSIVAAESKNRRALRQEKGAGKCH